ncbi:MAG: ABC transporter permease [Lachnospiraceae bacterium]|jgi:ABC-type uncharacterized transport system permease subunit|nr:ABC transporter permease [Lachnospiraceae bacterium]
MKIKEKLTVGRAGLDSLFRSAVALLLSLLVSAVIMAACGYNPIQAYGAIFTGSFGSLRGITQTLTQATPLIFTGLAFTFAKKASLINLGVEGQMYMGALGAVLIALPAMGLPGPVHLMLAILGGMAFGGAYAAIIGFLKVKFGSNEVVAGFMLNSIATYIVGYLLNGPLLAEGSNIAQTARVAESAWMPRIFSKYQVTYAVFLAVAACIFVAWFMKKTVTGYEIRCVGMNKDASETAGIRVGRSLVIAMCVSGAIAGLAGVNQVLGVDRRLINEFSPGYGFNGIAVSALAAENPVGTILAGVIFGVLRAGVMELNRTTNIPIEFVDVIQAMVVVFVSAPLLIRNLGGHLSRLKPARGAKGGAVQ